MEFDGMNDAELTILSLLAETDRFGQELQKIIDERGLREWVHIGFSSLFYLLDKLENQKMIKSTLQPDAHGIGRKKYSLTNAGRGILQTAVSDLLRQPRGIGTGFGLGVANVNVLKPRQVYQLLSHHRSDLEKRLKHVLDLLNGESISGDPTEPNHALYSYSATMMQAEFDWLTSFLDDWAEKHPDALKPSTEPELPDILPEDRENPNNKPTRRVHPITPPANKRVQKIKRPKSDSSEE